jgi:tetratricopeptide (TPR) repeat protein
MYPKKNPLIRKPPIRMKKLTMIAFTLLVSFAVFARNYDDSVNTLLKKAKLEQEAGRQKLALEYLQMAVAVNPGIVEAQKMLGLQALDLRQFDLARQSFLKVLESNPTDVVSLEKVTGIVFNFRRWDETIKYGQKLIAMKAGSRINYMVGKSYYEQENYAQSFRYLDAAYVEEPNNIEIPTLFARALADMSNFKASVRYYQEALKLDSNNNRLINELAMTYSAMNDEKTAVKYYELAMEKGYKVDNNFIENLSNSYIAAGQPDKGMDLLLKMLEKRPGDVYIHNNIADSYYSMGKYKEAINYWDKALFLDREDARSLYMIGMSYIKMGDKNKGATLCNKAIEMDPNLQQFRAARIGW